jgi:hypothetical protein
VQTDDEFSPSLLILGIVYEVEATTELDARARAAARFGKGTQQAKAPAAGRSNPRRASRLMSAVGRFTDAFT